MTRFFSLFLVITVFIGGLSTFYFYHSLTEKKKVNLELKVKKNETVKSVIKKLKETKVIENEIPLYIYTKFSNAEIKAGCYKLEGELSPLEILKELSTGSPCLVKITIKEGDDIFSIDKLLSQKGFCKKGEVLKLSRDSAFLKNLKIPFLEGFIFPDTYYVNEDASCKEIIKLAVENFKRKTKNIFDNYEPLKLVKDALGKINKEKILIVASIVEKETSLEEEKPIIASVIYNRLKRKMKLQCDPTVLYAYKMKGVEKDKLHKGDTNIASPYNTYYIKGLPKTPICNPSLSSIKAAMYPKETPYLYFVAKCKGHIFSKSYNQHLKAIRKVRNAREAKKETLCNR
ncbi:MAG: endolytic transglycosylase MltG [Desulfurobacteriaceae bacterium]